MKDGRNEIAIKRLNLAKRYLENAKEDLKKAKVDRKVGIYIDIKYISKASGTAYLSALEALKALFINYKILDEKEMKEKLNKVEMYDYYLKKVSQIGKDRDVLLKLFDEVYKILHLGGYYRELQDKKAIDSGFEKVEKIIKIVESYVKNVI
jgi:HEPN domain-containing protein